MTKTQLLEMKVANLERSVAGIQEISDKNAEVFQEVVFFLELRSNVQERALRNLIAAQLNSDPRCFAGDELMVAVPFPYAFPEGEKLLERYYHEFYAVRGMTEFVQALRRYRLLTTPFSKLTSDEQVTRSKMPEPIPEETPEPVYFGE